MVQLDVRGGLRLMFNERVVRCQRRHFGRGPRGRSGSGTGGTCNSRTSAGSTGSGGSRPRVGQHGVELQARRRRMDVTHVVFERSGRGASQPDVQVVANVDLDELGQPWRLPHRCELFDEVVVLMVGEMDDAPQVERSLFAATDRVLDMKARLLSARMQGVAAVNGQLRLAGERNLLLFVVQVRPLEDQTVGVRASP